MALTYNDAVQLGKFVCHNVKKETQHHTQDNDPARLSARGVGVQTLCDIFFLMSEPARRRFDYSTDKFFAVCGWE